MHVFGKPGASFESGGSIGPHFFAYGVRESGGVLVGLGTIWESV